MPTKHPRVNITFEEATVALISDLAHQEHKSVSSFAKELILEALERREDMNLSALAEIRDQAASKKVKHEDVWN
ncbi:MAG: hypothetical protein J0H12_00080 [Candidatus Paracaedimonas acanthamoebae]|uniref:Uncharacterized protein n=1 Tax=Candidatus Paracaedimonas acanthamoebae TaxID=244581 RepID=A0A8J7TU29_9PROT|nr:hypothetical protein [Candidatus Paracaedimonas acanthamoebae]OJX91525.1 MAG: hypothetical protein BGO90_08565 [Legionella sp. 40-6]